MGNRDIQNANLRPGEHKFTQEEHKKGARKSAESRRAMKTFREMIQELSEADKKQMLNAMIDKAKRGDTKAFELLRDTGGEKPVDKVKNENVNVEIPLEEYLKKASDDNEY